MHKFHGILLTALLVVSSDASANKLMEFLRSYDMNDYSLGVAVSARQNPFIGGENSLFAYPYLTSFTHWSMTDGWILIRDGGYGIRWVSDNDWELGVIARPRTLGLGNSAAEELTGIADRKWTIEMGPTIGYRGWPVHINWTLWDELLGRHGGYVSDLSLALPIDLDRGFIVPRVHAIYESADHSNYYYSVSAAEATPTRPAYTPGSTWNARAEVRVGYEVSPKWLLTATVGAEWLGSEITNSPIVGRDRVLFGNVGLAYNADIFNPTALDNYDRPLPTIDLRVAAFFTDISSKVRRDTADGVPGIEIDLENILGTPQSGTAIEVDALWRTGTHHQFELGYFDLVRNGTTTLENDLRFGDLFLPAGTVVDSQVDYSSLRFGYTFFLMRDAQKELGFMVGMHLSELAVNVRTETGDQVERSRSSTPLPVIGLNGALFLGERTTLRARIHLFRTDFDQHEGALNYAALDLERVFGKRIRAGIGYNLYATRLESNSESLNGSLDIRHHGPVVYVTLGF
ncbi:MAG: MipA/OmpV family protein [Woeseiaceae bacterium]|nr:MipA/OmpV family protein [Woeseiaceae bacterium]